jgi:hypothetical protein
MQGPARAVAKAAPRTTRSGASLCKLGTRTRRAQLRAGRGLHRTRRTQGPAADTAGTIGAADLRSMPSEYAELNNLYVCASLTARPFSRAD